MSPRYSARLVATALFRVPRRAGKPPSMDSDRRRCWVTCGVAAIAVCLVGLLLVTLGYGPKDRGGSAPRGAAGDRGPSVPTTNVAPSPPIDPSDGRILRLAMDLTDPDREIRDMAAATFIEESPGVESSLARLLRVPNMEAKRAALLAIPLLPEPGLPLMEDVVLLATGGPLVWEAGECLSALVARSDRATDLLLARLESAEPFARTRFLSALGSASRRRPELVGTFVRELQHRDPEVRLRAIWGIRDGADRSEAVMDPILSCFEKEDDEIVLSVMAEVLGDLERPPEAVKARLRGCALRGNREARFQVAFVMGRWGARGNWDERTVLALLADADPVLRCRTLNAVPFAPRPGEMVLARVRELLKDADPAVRERAAETLVWVERR